jgi:O-methyltransferase involved in polyketide biosynthesis
MPTKISVELGNVQKTLFLPLWGRAVETKKENPLLVDQTAVEILEKVDYDFSTIAQNINPLSQAAWIMRSICINEVICSRLARNPDATIVNLGCGFDTTFDRVDNGLLTWYDLDLPDVIQLREKFIPQSDRRKFIASSFLDEDWLDKIGKPVEPLFIAAGVFYYFEENEIRQFLLRLTEHFPGAEIFFDVSSPYGVKVANKKVIESSGLDEKSHLKWGLENPGVVSAWDARFKVLETVYYFGRRGRRLPLKLRAIGCLSDYLKVQYMIHLKI